MRSSIPALLLTLATAGAMAAPLTPASGLVSIFSKTPTGSVYLCRSADPSSAGPSADPSAGPSAGPSAAGPSPWTLLTTVTDACAFNISIPLASLALPGVQLGTIRTSQPTDSGYLAFAQDGSLTAAGPSSPPGVDKNISFMPATTSLGTFYLRRASSPATYLTIPATSDMGGSTTAISTGSPSTAWTIAAYPA